MQQIMRSGVVSLFANAWRGSRRDALHGEGGFIAALGNPLIATRPLRPDILPSLAAQLLEHWFVGGRALLPVVSARSGDGRSHLAAQLAVTFAGMGVKTLLVDASLRKPAQHGFFRAPNRDGLSDLLAGGSAKPVTCGEHLGVLVAGAARLDPLELLCDRRLPGLLKAAGTKVRVVLIDTPAAAQGPDYEMFAALAGGALVLARRGADLRALARLGKTLRRCAARPVATLLAAH